MLKQQQGHILLGCWASLMEGGSPCFSLSPSHTLLIRHFLHSFITELLPDKAEIPQVQLCPSLRLLP